MFKTCVGPSRKSYTLQWNIPCRNMQKELLCVRNAWRCSEKSMHKLLEKTTSVLHTSYKMCRLCMQGICSVERKLRSLPCSIESCDEWSLHGWIEENVVKTKWENLSWFMDCFCFPRFFWDFDLLSAASALKMEFLNNTIVTSFYTGWKHRVKVDTVHAF